MEYKYNRLGEVIQVVDQNGTTHEFEYDGYGRRTADKVTAFGGGVDQAVKRISLAYDDRGLLAKVTSFDHLTNSAAANVVNQVELVYNGFGQLTADRQEHGAAFVGTGTPKVEYAYADGSANHVRPTMVTYPNGRKLHYTYGTAASAADRLSRVDALKDDNGSGSPGAALAAYTYLGAGSIVRVDLRSGGDITYQLNHGTGNDPHDGGLDRFDRVIDLRCRAIAP